MYEEVADHAQQHGEDGRAMESGHLNILTEDGCYSLDT